MKAMILAAGFGKRLWPITKDRPKALLDLNGKTILELVIKRLAESGADSIVVNTHYLADQIDYFLKNNNFGIKVEPIYEPELLETGGAISNAYEFLKDKDPVIVHNVDIYSDINLKELYDFHKENSPFATIATSRPAGDQPFLIDRSGFLVGFRNKTSGREILLPGVGDFAEHTFCGVHVLSQEFLKKLISRKTKGISISDIHVDMAKEGEKIKSFDVGSSFWIDTGTIERYEKLKKILV